MPFRRQYRCLTCGWDVEVMEGLQAAGPWTCAICGQPYSGSVPSLLPPFHVSVPGGTGSAGRRGVFVGASRPFIRPMVAPDVEGGGEVVYRSLEQAERMERERCRSPMVARQNVRTLRQRGWVAGTRRAELRQALEARVGIEPDRDLI